MDREGHTQRLELLWKENQGRRKKQRHQIIDLGEWVGLYENVEESPMLTTITSTKFSPFGDFLVSRLGRYIYTEEFSNHSL